MLIASSLLGLFAVAFAAATLLPMQSEPVFVALQLAGHVPLWALVLVAGLANTLGAFVNYAIGRGIDGMRPGRWKALTPERIARARDWFSRWGVWTLLLSWAPVGDVLTVIAGAMRTPLWLFGLLVAIGKTGRYIALAAITHAATAT